VRYFVKFLEGNRLPTTAPLIGADHIRAYIVYLKRRPAYADHPYTGAQARGLSDSSINNYIRGLSAFWTWLEEEDLVDHNPFDRVRIPKVGYKVITPFSEADIAKLLGAIDPESRAGFRDRTVILVFLDTALRLSELLGIKMADLRLEENTIRVLGKGNKQRIVPFGSVVKKHLWRYLSRHRPEPARPFDDYLFLTDDGAPLTKSRLESMMHRYGDKAGLTGLRVSPHTMRHTSALAFLRNGGDAFSLQRLLGHASLDVTRRYCALADNDVTTAHRAASPVDHLAPRHRRGQRQTALDCCQSAKWDTF
jgi:site-specific recombinase XerD